MLRSKRFEKLAERDVNKDVFIDELHELGLTIMDSPNDPNPSIEIEKSRGLRLVRAPRH